MSGFKNKKLFLHTFFLIFKKHQKQKNHRIYQPWWCIGHFKCREVGTTELIESAISSVQQQCESKCVFARTHAHTHSTPECVFFSFFFFLHILTLNIVFKSHHSLPSFNSLNNPLDFKLSMFAHRTVLSVFWINFHQKSLVSISTKKQLRSKIVQNTRGHGQNSFPVCHWK